MRHRIEIVIGVALPFAGAHRPAIANVDRKTSALNHDNRGGPYRIGKVAGILFGIDRCARDHHSQVRPSWKQALQIGHEQIDIERSFVGFVEDDAIVGIQEPISLDFGQQNSVGHQLDKAGGLCLVVESNFVSYDTTSLGLQLFGQAMGDRTSRNSSRLGMPDPTELA